MDKSMLRNVALELKNLFKGTAKLQTNSVLAKSNPEAIKISKGMALFLIALLCAWISKTETEIKTRQQILQSEWPSSQIFYSVLNQGGWHRSEAVDLSVLLKNHPDPFLAQSVIWESEDHCFIYLTQSPYQNEASKPELWSCAAGHNKPKTKLKWRRVGSGYSGLNLLSQIILPRVKKTASYIDPKEIRY
jgi:hypothetical protein